MIENDFHNFMGFSRHFLTTIQAYKQFFFKNFHEKMMWLVGQKLTSKSFLRLVLGWCARKEFAGLCAIVRDCCGKVVLAGCSLGGRGLSPQCVKTEAICFGLSIALKTGFSPILLEFNALSVVNLVISKSSPYSDIGLFILDILNLLESPSVWGVSYSHKSTNMVAHSLAKLAFSFSSKSIWVVDFSPSVRVLF
ncbi:hypothetical protein ACOSQ2_004603 [Xanthoceras sorbifolium]